MRSFSKKLAFVLAAAMVFTAFAPAAKAEAAKEMAINKQGKILYVTDGTGINDAAQVGGGKGNVASYDFAVSNKPANYKETHSFAWSSSNPEIIKVGKAGLTTAVSVGKADVICVVTEKATGKTTTLTNTITVKANAADVEITNAGDAAGVAYEVGSTIDFNRAMYDANGNKTTKRGTLVTDYTEWLVEPSNGVTITQSNGKYTFTEPGEYKVWCRTYQSNKYRGTTAESDVVKVTIEDNALELTQTTRSKFVIDGLDGVIGLNDVRVEEVVSTIMGDDRVNYLVKDVTMNADNKSAVVELFYEFNDGGVYEITVKGYDTEGMIASKGEPKIIHLYADPNNEYGYGVLVGTDAPILYKVYDVKGVDVTLPGLYDENISYTIKYTDANYEDTADYLTFAEVGDKAVVTASFCSYEVDADGNYTNEFTSKPFTFYGVDKATSVVHKIEDYAVDGGYAWGKKSIKLEDEADGHTLEVKIVLTDNLYNPINLTQFDQVIYNTSGDEIGTATFTALNPDYIEVKPSETLGDDNLPKVELEPRKKGTGRIMVSYNTIVNDVEVSTMIGIVNVEVIDRSELNSVAIDMYADDYKVVVSGNRIITCTNPAIGSELEDPFVTVGAWDQYGSWYPYFEIVDEDGAFVGKSTLAQQSIDEGAISIDGNALVIDSDKFDDILEENKATAKTFQYSIKVKDTKHNGTKSLTFTVDARNPISNIKAVVEKDEAAKYFTTTYKLETRYAYWWNGNVARVASGHDNSAPMKSACFIVWDMKNSAKYDELYLNKLPNKKKETIDSSATGAYYMIFKDGVNITEKASVGELTYGNGSAIALNFSTVKPSKYNDAVPVVYYNHDESNFVGGAGKYEFVYYEIKEDNNGNKKLYQKQKSTIVTTVDTGKYEFVKRTEVYASDARDQQTLLRCFQIKDRDGKTYGYWDVKDNNTVVINGSTRLFQVIVDENLSNDKSVFVDKIVFWEYVGDAFAEYVVEVDLFVDYAVE